jgi:transposase
MAKGYRPVVRDQVFLFPPDMREWLPPDHPVWLVIKVVEDHLDTSAFHRRRRTGGAGTAGYDPDMLVTLLTWAYAHQVTSSRRIEELCRTDVAFRVICAGDVPDHVTIARLRAGFAGAVEELFAGVLALCARLGMGRLGVVALDGMKIAADASRSANRTEDKLRELAAQAVARHGDTDAAEDALFGDGRGDEVPAGAWHPRRRDERIAAALADLEAERAAAAAEREALARAHLEPARAGTPRRGNRPAEVAVELAQLNLDNALAAQQASIDDWQRRSAGSLARTGRPLRGHPPVPASGHFRVKAAAATLERARGRAAAAQQKAAAKAASAPAPVRNITDPDSRLMPVRGGGFIQAYNAQNVTSEDGLIIATELTADPTDTAWYEPMLRDAEEAAAFITARQPAPGDSPAAASQASPPAAGDAAAGDAAAGQDGLIGLFLADAGYCSEHNLTIPGPGRLIATGKHRALEKAARTGPDATPASLAVTAMAARLATEEGITAYRQRSHIAETPHGNIKHNMGFRQLSVRGKPKAAAEWKFTCTVHNLFKAITAGHLTTQALTTLAR